jgi:uncharacterized membrane protein
MDAALLSLAAASLAFVGTHFLLSHPLRAPIVARFGEGPFLLLYSLVAFATLGWMALAFRAAPAPDLPGSGTIGWIAASVLSLVALVLFLGSLRRNPAFPDPKQSPSIPQQARGVFAVTRHPMMWGFALWALSHAILVWSWRTMVVALAIGVLALVGAHLQDRKKQRLLGGAWAEWKAKTSYWPRWGRLFFAGWLLWLLAIVLWLALSWLHLPSAGVPAGVWRWLG